MLPSYATLKLGNISLSCFCSYASCNGLHEKLPLSLITLARLKHELLTRFAKCGLKTQFLYNRIIGITYTNHVVSQLEHMALETRIS